MDVIVRETTEDIHKMGGMLSRIERLVDIPVLKAVRVRMPWLFICLAGGLVASGIIGAFEQILRTIIVLAFFIPVIMDMGGNVGVQSTTLIVRAMATKQIGTRDAWKAVRKELEIGALMGLVSGVLVGIAASVWQTPLIGLVVGIAMFLTLLVAASLGAVLPFLFRFVGVDPALTSGPFVTTIKDILALCIYFGVALSLAGYLLG
jgi:magnesium transporter